MTGTPYRVAHHYGPSTWQRADTVTIAGDRVTITTHAAGPADMSPRWAGYAPACPWCWLGTTHTTTAHAESVTR